MKIVTAEQMREIDRKTIEVFGMPSRVLMERAGHAVAEKVCEFAAGKAVTAVCGGGNNGGDGIVAARILKSSGYKVKTLMVGREDRLSPDCREQYRLAREMGLDIEFRIPSGGDLSGTVVIDAIFGTGLNKPVEGPALNAIEAINAAGMQVFSVDMPSGISADDGRVMGDAVKADYTVTFGLPKIGHFLYPGAEYSGKVVTEDIGFPESLTGSEEIKCNLISADMVRKLIVRRRPDSNKGLFGYIFSIAGSRGKTGAAMLSARGCLRAGAGAVTMGVAEELLPVFESKVLEEMTVGLKSNEEGTISKMASEAALAFINGKTDVVLLGPGLGLNDDVSGFVRDIVLNSEKPMLIDADGLNCIAREPEILKQARAGIVITPHPGEMKRLLREKMPDISIGEIDSGRIGKAGEFAAEYRVICVLKGAPTIVASPGGEVFLNPTGNPGMSTAGSGDVLSGIIAAFMGQGLDPLEAAYCGVYMHGLAGDIARDHLGEYSLIAGDLIEFLPHSFRKLQP